MICFIVLHINLMSFISLINEKQNNINIYNINKEITILWHSRFGHINKKRISKIPRDGILGSHDYESYEYTNFIY